jgi:hypothetical protein
MTAMGHSSGSSMSQQQHLWIKAVSTAFEHIYIVIYTTRLYKVDEGE